MYERGYLQGSENGRVVTIAKSGDKSCGRGKEEGTDYAVTNKTHL